MIRHRRLKPGYDGIAGKRHGCAEITRDCEDWTRGGGPAANQR
jgi:hypothetical protein